MTAWAIPQTISERLTPPEPMTVSEWCDRNRVLQNKHASEPGPWRTDRTPYLREILDALADPEVGSISFVKSSRVGGTEMVNNWLAWGAECDPMPTLYILPKEGDAKEEFGGRIKGVFDPPSPLSRLVTGDFCKLDPPTLALNSMTVYGAWASSPGTMIRRTCGRVFFDEIDNCDAEAGRLGNTWQLASDRVTTFGHRAKLASVSTPTTTNASGWRNYERSDQRRYHVPCPTCGGYQVLKFGQLKVPPGERSPDKIEAEDLARYECEACGDLIPWSDQRWMILRGVWLSRTQKIIEPLPLDDADAVERAALWGAERWTPAVDGEPPITRNRGYHIWSAYSPWRPWSQIMAKFFRVRDHPEEFRVFINSWLGEPWEETEEELKDEVVREKIDGALWHADIVPPEALQLVCGADVQQDHLYYVIRAWGPNQESWLIRNGQVSTFEQLYQVAFQLGFPQSGRDRRMICMGLAIDSGFRTDEVYEFGKRPGVVVVKGRQTMDAPFKQSRIDYQPRGRSAADSLVLHTLNVDYFKRMAHRLVAQPEGHAGQWHLNRDTSEDYVKQFTSEHQVVERRKGKRSKVVWKPKTDGAANHYLDCEVYGLALAHICNLHMLKREDVSEPVLVQPQPAEPEIVTQPSAPPRRKRRGWQMNRRSW